MLQQKSQVILWSNFLHGCSVVEFELRGLSPNQGLFSLCDIASSYIPMCLYIHKQGLKTQVVLN